MDYKSLPAYTQNLKSNISPMTIFGTILGITLLILLFVCLLRKKPENFCSCRHETKKICPDPKVLTDLYNSGKLTEFTDFEAIRNKYGGGANNWKITMPEDEFAKNNYQ